MRKVCKLRCLTQLPRLGLPPRRLSPVLKRERTERKPTLVPTSSAVASSYRPLNGKAHVPCRRRPRGSMSGSRRTSPEELKWFSHELAQDHSCRYGCVLC